MIIHIETSEKGGQRNETSDWEDKEMRHHIANISVDISG